MSASYDSNLLNLFQALGWQKLSHQRLLEKKSIMMYKTLFIFICLPYKSEFSAEYKGLR